MQDAPFNAVCQTINAHRHQSIQLAHDNILSELLCFRIPAELSFATIPGWQMDKVSSTLVAVFPSAEDPVTCSINVFIWSIALCAHAACTSFGGLLAVRFILGMCEGAVTAGFLIVTSMFYTKSEQMARIGYWCKPCLMTRKKTWGLPLLISFVFVSKRCNDRPRIDSPRICCVWCSTYKIRHLRTMARV